MLTQPDTLRPGVQSLLETLSKGRPLPNESAEALARLVGVRPGLEGLSRLFQPGFPGIRTFAVDIHAAPDQAVELTLVGVARNGKPVWSGTRAFAFGRDGSLEIHRGFDEIDPEYQSRNITVDLMQRELDLLALLRRGRASRLTIDAEGVGRYICALHGFVFADETEEGPPVRSARSLEPTGDRDGLTQAARTFVPRYGERREVGKIAIEVAMEQVARATSPWDFARLRFPDARPLPDSDEGAMGVSDLGREFLLGKETPAWRAALYVVPRDERAYALGLEYRRLKTARSEARLARELMAAKDAALNSTQRAVRIRGLETLAQWAPPWLAPDIRALTEGADRRVAAFARQTLRQISGSDLPGRMLTYADDARHPAPLRGLAYRVLAEHFPDQLRSRVDMLRVHPDARIQRAVVPIVAQGPEQAKGLASMLAANPWSAPERSRAGLLALRLELIDRLRTRADPSTLPCLMQAFRSQPAPLPAEQLALSRALVAFPDPRAQTVLMEAARRIGRPEIP
ncbi:MAG: hypothetical protein H6730_17120 [Deltaproteobacteria bacterium]|nr:hypothetical protein [Deltaproteobacteria bacterium]